LSTAALVISILLSMGSLAWDYNQAGFSRLAAFFLIFGLLWLLAQWRRWDWFSSLGLFVVVFGAAIGLWLEFSMAWMLASAAFALFAWDVTEFRRRLYSMIVDDYHRGMERRHIARVSLVILAGMLLTTVALVVQLQFTFEWGVFLVIIILLGMAQLVAWFRRQ